MSCQSTDRSQVRAYGAEDMSLLVRPFRSGNQNVLLQSWLMDEDFPDDHLLTSYWTTVIGVRDKTPPC